MENGKPFPVTKWKISDAGVCVRHVELLCTDCWETTFNILLVISHQ